jgi:hypothetical protein
MKGWLRYAFLATAIVAAAIATAAMFAPAAVEGALLAGATALAVQLAAFAVLAPARGKPHLVLAAWVFGVLMRLGVVLGVALWLTRGGPFEARPTLLMLVVLLTLLALLEAPALRRLDETEVRRGP